MFKINNCNIYLHTKVLSKVYKDNEWDLCPAYISDLVYTIYYIRMCTYVLDFFFAFSIFVNLSIALLYYYLHGFYGTCFNCSHSAWDPMQTEKIKSGDLKNTHVMKNYTKIMKQIIQELFFCFPQPTLPSLCF